MVHLQSLYMKAVERERPRKLEKQNTLQKAYKAIVQLGSKYLIYLGVKTLRMLTWTSNQVILARDLAEDLKRKKVSFLLVRVYVI